MSTLIPLRTLLVMGASGFLGRRVVDLLMEARAGTVIAASRSPDKISNVTLRGAEVREADPDDPASLDAAFVGVHRMLIISTDAIDSTGRRLQRNRNAIEAAARAGVQHIVYTSVSSAAPDSVVAGSPDHYETEQMLAASSLGWTVLRKNIYAENLLPALTQAVATGRWETAAGDGYAAYITREDYAQAAAASIAYSFDGRHTLDVTGPMGVSHAMIARWLSETTGKPVTYVAVELASVVAKLIEAGLSPEEAETQASFDAGVARGEFAKSSRVVAELTGRPPMNIPSFIRAHRPRLLGI